MLLNLAGLSILRASGDETLAIGASELVWRDRRCENVPEAARPVDGTTRSFGYDGRTMCRFDIDAAGRQVESWTVPAVSERDLLALFGEHILRSVLVRRGLTSFHAASLTNGDCAILIMGDKGMGKSTLSSALQHRGWTTVADDLTRVAGDDGHFHAFPGLRDTKLLPDSVAALGLRDDTLALRWDDAGDVGGGKRLLAPFRDLPSDPQAFRVVAMLVLQARHAGERPSHRIAARHHAVRHLLYHATADELAPYPPPLVQRAIGQLIDHVPVVEVALPDQLTALHESAAAIEALLYHFGMPGR